MSGLLDGVRVVDLSRVLAGPFAAQMLGEMGADVVKVEPPAGDPARGIGPFIDGRSLYFSSLNTNKRGVVLDLATDSGKAGLHAILSGADIVIENMRPDAAAKLGVTGDVLLQSHPHLVVTTISSYARSSDRADEASYDLVAQAESGIMSVTGERGGPPVRAGVAISDLAAGMWAALGAVAGYARRLQTGTGCRVEVPLLDSALSLLTYVATAAMGTGEDPVAVGSGHHNIVPYRAFATRDGWVVVAVLGDKFWPMVCDALGLGDLAARGDLATNDQRTAARSEIDLAIESAVGGLSTAEALARLSAAGVPHGPINSVLQAVGSPYVQAEGIVAEIASPEGPYRIVRGPLRDGRPPRPAPGLGEHTQEILTAVMDAGSPHLAQLLRT